MRLIWFNPDIAMFCTGAPSEFEEEISLSMNQSSFDILYRLNDTYAQIAPKIIRQLNKKQLEVNMC